MLRAQLEDPIGRKLHLLLARRALRWESGSAAVDWAVAALEAGWDAKPIAILAGLKKPPNEFEVDRYLEESLGSLGLTRPAESELADIYAWIVAGDILSARVTPRNGCAELSRICSSSGYPVHLMAFYSASEALDLAERGIYGAVDSVEQDIVETARRFVVAPSPCLSPAGAGER